MGNRPARQDAPVESLDEFGVAALLVSAGLAAAIYGRAAAERFAIPTAAVLLVAAAVVTDLFDGLRDAISIEAVQWVTSAALIVILFDGGLHIGLRRFRAAAVPIAVLGVVGTFATAGLVAVAAHALLDLSWTVSGLIGAAVAPTDPAVTFSVLGGKEIRGRAGTILEGESGFNDPVGIALMIGMVELATTEAGSFSLVIEEFLVEMGVGLAVGIVGSLVALRVARRVALPDRSLYPLRVLALAGLLFGVASLAHGSGFLAVFVAGIVLGDAAAPHKGEIERFMSTMGNLGEIAAFVALGLTIDLAFIGDEGLWVDGLLLAVLLAFVIRPLVVTPLLLPVRLSWGERGFVVWSGLKGAVPILLASLAVVGDTAYAREIYAIVFVVVLFSVVVQGTGVPIAARVCHVPMRAASRGGEAARHFVVRDGAFAAGTRLAELPLAERAWVEAVYRDGQSLPVHAETVLAPGDGVLVLCELESVPVLNRIFEGRQVP
jgi:cell volume regulation protein A